MKKLFLLFTALCHIGAATATVTLDPLLGDNMVLQRDCNAAIWGKAKPSTEITITPSWSGKTYTTRSDKNGSWETAIDTKGVGGPYTIKISDGEELTVRNIMLGDVWICSGQSNMEMNFAEFTGQPVENSLRTVIESPKYNKIRMYTVAKSLSDTLSESVKEGKQWEMPSFENTPGFSAAAYFFAKTLYEILDIPIGIIQSSAGGSSIEQWLDHSKENLKKYPHFKALDRKADSTSVKWFQTSTLYNGMMYPLRKISFKGFTMYHGEANYYNCELYADMFTDLIRQWRDLFKHPDAPFYFVQVAPYGYRAPKSDRGGFLREAQAKALALPNTGMVVTMDIGSTCVHPPQKEILGQRLAYQALAKTYHLNIPCDGPTLNKYTIEGDKFILIFDHAEGGLCPLGNVEGFELAGTDGKFYPAKTHVKYGKKVEVMCKEVQEPKYIRYAYKNMIEGTLFNAYHLPAAPFRTDTFKPMEK